MPSTRARRPSSPGGGRWRREKKRGLRAIVPGAPDSDCDSGERREVATSRPRCIQMLDIYRGAIRKGPGRLFVRDDDMVVAVRMQLAGDDRVLGKYILSPPTRRSAGLHPHPPSSRHHTVIPWSLSTIRLLARNVICHASAHISKHVLNAQVSIRAPCCKLWFDCAECHAETQDHRLKKTAEMAFLCKKCKKAFRKDMSNYEESDEYCPHCDNHYVIEAKTPQAVLGVEGDDPRINARMLKDERVKEDASRSLFPTDLTDRIG